MSKYSVKKPITVLMGVLIIIVLGLFSLTRLPVTLFPEINLPFVVTITSYQGANPEEVEQEIANQIEPLVSTIGNFKEVTSMSNEHFGISIITFSAAANMDSVIIELRELLNNITFAEGVGSTRIVRITPDMLPVMTLTLYRQYDQTLTDEEILIKNTEWVNQDIIHQLTSIEGVADVTISGAADVVLSINLDQDLLNTHGLTHNDVLAIIEEQNVDGLIGVALDSGELRMLYLGNRPAQLKDIKLLPITISLGEVINLSDLAIPNGIKFVNANLETYSKINGIQGIQISFQKQADHSVTEVTNNITNRLNEITAEDSNAGYSILLNQGEYINKAIGSVLQNLIIGAILAIFILFLFLRDIKPTLIVGLAIPISVIAAMALMYFTNVSLNLVSMGGLALGIGMLVDNSIVVIENIYRMIGEGKTKVEAAVSGARQVAGAITASTLTTIAVFLPIVFIDGMVADIFISMALTIAYSLGASLIIALTMVPALASRFLNEKDQKQKNKGLTKIQAFYKKAILVSIKYKAISLILVVLLLITSTLLVTSKGFIMLPPSDEGIINVEIQTTRQTEFQEKALFTDYLTEKLLQIEDIKNISASINSDSRMRLMLMGNSNIIYMTINLVDNRTKSTDELVLVVKALIDDLDYTLVGGLQKTQIEEISVSAQNSTAGFAGPSGINIKVAGHNLLTLESISHELTAIIANVDGVATVDSGINQGIDNVKITVNNNNAMLLGLTNQDIIDNIALLYTNLDNLGQDQNTTVTIEGIDYTLDLPNEAIGGEIDFAAFGDYQTFFGGVQLFDDQTRLMIDQFLLTSEQGIYLPNMMLASYNDGDQIQMVINPFLKITNGQIVFDPVSTNPTLASLSLAPLFTTDPLTSVTIIDKVTGFLTINTDGSNRFLTVSAQVEEGKNVTIVNQRVITAVNEYLNSDQFLTYGSSYTVTFEGEAEEIIKAISDLALAALVAILLVYMIMAIQFQSLSYPLIILISIPLAFTGGMMALLVTNLNLSLVAFMGLIVLIGIVVNNGIVLIDYINKLRDQGYQVIEAIVKGGQTRLRPVVMTALTTILALLAMAIGIGQGDEMLQPMAITSIGGLFYATLTTLVIVPTMYALFNYKTIRQEAKENDDNQK